MATVGGARAGAGRPKGSTTKIQKIIKQASKSDATILPHEWLLKIVRGEPIPQKSYRIIYDGRGGIKSKELIEEDVYPDFQTRVDAAKYSAQFFAAKMVAQTNEGGNEQIAEALKELATKLPT